MACATALVTVLAKAPEAFNTGWMLVLLVLFNTLLVAGKSVPRSVNAFRVA
jgi:hypothetical protein